MNPIRVLIVDDSAFMRMMISDILSSDNRIEVIATARNGEDGIKKIKQLKPDVVTLDIEMPKMDGLTALTKIMETHPLPVVILSSFTSDATTKTVQAISNGAVDFITKPTGLTSLEKIKEGIILKVVAASKVKNQSMKPLKSIPNLSTIRTPYKNTLVAIGTSTGGPKALQQLLVDLSGKKSPPILVVQHMPSGFTKSLANRLNTLTDLHVKEAEHGEVLEENTVYIAPGDYHMEVRKVGTSHAIVIHEDVGERYPHTPSVDVLFQSLAKVQRVNKVAIVLTGMGSDGSNGIIKLKENDPNTIVIAESEESTVVYGMPRAAVKTNYVNYIINLNQLGETLHKITTNLRGM
ncbi:protein-glutamate methylesterase/protein-glutamine glutaminase [Ornithinibacillus halophilus]|uniref:Protein-glutamate methylesterase/protein-glutamine glutaminase n=1 Tax=Ornithinibacillus halophilus TaxID=930117 RepID=A0A1M5CB85_9BACI|nr:chemotaxis response regulator protein-glutamate methylesterase [Ornithinibacillus halophilus]SHF52023.1 two-component system, chemotaxis family, response regulator CheB [Ornithinibacillus halophilus]